jgi:RNA polymerase sigma-70 factor (ECF subfamily)
VDASEFDAFYAGAYPRVARAVYALTGDVGESQDVAQEAFVRAWDHRRELDRDRNPEAWVMTTASRIAVSRWRRLRTASRSTQRLATDTTAAGPTGDRIDIVRALRELPPPQREAIVLVHLCDLTVVEVAQAQRVPVGTVKARLSRGRAALAALLADPPAQDG